MLARISNFLRTFLSISGIWLSHKSHLALKKITVIINDKLDVLVLHFKQNYDILCNQVLLFAFYIKDGITMSNELLTGVIEGYYGRPWTNDQRYHLFNLLSQTGLNAYMYAPKDDEYHRQKWDEPYPAEMLSNLGEYINACNQNHIHFIYAIAPGLTIEYTSEEDYQSLKKKLHAVFSKGCRTFAILFDDIPENLSKQSKNQFKTFAGAQSYLTNKLFAEIKKWDPSIRLLFCPTEYCDAFTPSGIEQSVYLKELGETLDKEIDIFWTGERIIPPTITVDEMIRLKHIIKRKPIIWDNLFANDYDVRRIYFGPFEHREKTILGHLNGFLLNPNIEYWANIIPILSFGRFVQNPDDYHPYECFKESAKVFGEMVGLPEMDFSLLLEFFYNPFYEGPRAEKVLSLLKECKTKDPKETKQSINELLTLLIPIKSLLEQLPKTKNRNFFYSFYPYISDFSSELLYAYNALQYYISNGSFPKHFNQTQFHYSGTFRGGFVNRLMKIIETD